MSTQSAQTRSASQATVNAYQSRTEPVELVDEAPKPDTKVSVWWIPALLIGAWVELVYVVPVIAHWFAQLT